MDRGPDGNVRQYDDRCEGRGLRAHYHVDVVARRGHRAILHIPAGAEPVETVRPAGCQTFEGRAPEGRSSVVLVEKLPLQPPRQGGARWLAGISIPAGNR